MLLWIKVIKFATSKYMMYALALLAVVGYVFYLGAISRQHTIDDLEYKYQVAVGQIEALNAQVHFSQDLADRFTSIDQTLTKQISELGKVRGSIKTIKPTTIVYNTDSGQPECIPSEEFSKKWNEIGSRP